MKTLKQLSLATVIGVAATIGSTQPSSAAPQGEPRAEGRDAGPEQHRHGDGRGPNFEDRRSFDDHDRARWRVGHWAHERHEGRFGWWWVAGDDWFFYEDPAYPYPDPDALPQQDLTPDQDPVGFANPADRATA